MQTILGAGGAIGVELAKILPQYTDKIRLVSRNPKKVNESDELFPADLTNRERIFDAVKGSDVVYVLVGFPYKAKVWEKLWPPFMRNVIDACKEHGSKLVFFDNVYAVSPDSMAHITEESPLKPTSVKGKVRKEVAEMLLQAIDKGEIQGIIARSADFYSDIKATSLLMSLMYDNLKKGKKAQWFCKSDVVHTCSYTPDLAKGTAILGNTESAYNQVWNLPTSQEKISANGFAELFAKEMNAKSNKVQVLPSWGIKLLGVFVPIVGEMYEMRYQYDRDYFFDCSKFLNTFDFEPTSHEKAVKEVVSRLEKVQ